MTKTTKTTKSGSSSAKSTSKPSRSSSKRPTRAATPPAPARRSKVPAPKPRVAAASTSEAESTMSGPELKKQELIQKVVTRTGAKKKDAKPVVEAMLEVLGEALADGRELNLQPFGKLKLNRTKETANARIIVAKIRQGKKAASDVKDTVAAAAE